MIKYYTRACNFKYGSKAKQLIKTKKALPLCGNKDISFKSWNSIRFKKVNFRYQNSNKKILKRDNAKVNENIFISGTLGRGYLGRLEYRKVDAKLNHFLMPKIPIHDIDIIREVASSCIDVSDGFLIDLKRILISSKVGADVFLNENFCTNGKADLICGDDYVLCFTSNLDEKDLTKLLPDSYYVGKIKKEQKLDVYDQNKNKLNFNKSGWDSFI